MDCWHKTADVQSTGDGSKRRRRSSDEASVVQIYTACETYQQLYAHRHLKTVARLIRCIITYNNTHRIRDTIKAFDKHRTLTLNGQLRKRRAHFHIDVPCAGPSRVDPLEQLQQRVQDQQEQITHLQQQLQQLQQHQQQHTTQPTCAICGTEPADSRLLPCRHEEFCHVCWTKQSVFSTYGGDAPLPYASQLHDWLDDSLKRVRQAAPGPVPMSSRYCRSLPAPSSAFTPPLTTPPPTSSKTR